MSNSRRNRRARERMRARDEGINRPIAMNAVNLLGAILSEMNRTGPIGAQASNGDGMPRNDFRESQEAAPAQPPPPDPDQANTEARKQAFRAIVAEFTAELRARCLAQTGKEDHFVSRGMTYRWKSTQDYNPRKCVFVTYKVTDEGFIRSMSVEMNSAGTITCGPAFFRSVCESLREAREARAAATEPPCAVPDVRPSMAFRDYQLIAMRNACSYMGQNLLWLGESPDGSRIKLLAECVDMIDAGLAAIGR